MPFVIGFGSSAVGWRTCSCCSQPSFGFGSRSFLPFHLPFPCPCPCPCPFPCQVACPSPCPCQVACPSPCPCQVACPSPCPFPFGEFRSPFQGTFLLELPCQGCSLREVGNLLGNRR